MWFFGALLIVSLPAWWLAAAISYFFEFYPAAAGFGLGGCASLLLAIKIAGPKSGRREEGQNISLYADAINHVDVSSSSRSS
jgi:hypothetical protein